MRATLNCFPPLNLDRDHRAAARTTGPDCSLEELSEALHQCERRLGTDAERAGDFERARELAHAINNRLQMKSLLSELGLFFAPAETTLHGEAVR